MKNREEIDIKYTWDLSQLCNNSDEFYQKIEKINEYLPKFKEFEGKLNNKSDILKYLKLEKEFSNFVEPLQTYTFLKLSEKLSDNKNQELSERLSFILNNFEVETSFATSELEKLPISTLDQFIKDEDFKDYDRFFETIKKDKKHSLSKAEEKLLSGMDFLSGFSTNRDMLSDVDIKFGKVKDSKGKTFELNHSSYSTLMRSQDRKLRKQAFIKMNGTFGKYINTFANNYINEVKLDCYFAKVRKYKSALERELKSEEIDKEVYEMLKKQVNNNLSILFDYFDIKKQILGLKTMYVYDCMADVGKSSQKKYSYDEAIELIKKAVSPLGEEYVNLIDKAKNERWIDVYPNKDKSSGAYEINVYGVHPYVMTNFEGDLDSVFTLIHELGHAMHSYFSDKNQPYSKAAYPIFLAEIASTTNEMLLINYLLKNTKNKEEKVALYNKLFDEVKGTIYRQTMFSEFEERVHSIYESGQSLTKDTLNGLYYVLNKKYFGSTRLVEEVRYEWARIPHFFRSFYVYKYATGLICAINFVNKILSNDENAIENYFKFLSAGNSKNPIKTLQNSHCDLKNKETFESCFNYLKHMLNEWKELIK